MSPRLPIVSLVFIPSNIELSLFMACFVDIFRCWDGWAKDSAGVVDGCYKPLDNDRSNSSIAIRSLLSLTKRLWLQSIRGLKKAKTELDTQSLEFPNDSKTGLDTQSLEFPNDSKTGLDTQSFEFPKWLCIHPPWLTTFIIRDPFFKSLDPYIVTPPLTDSW